MPKKKEDVKLTPVQLKGLKGKHTTKSVGDVYYRRYGAGWFISVSTRNSLGTKLVRNASFASIALAEEVIGHLKKLARPYSTINDKLDNSRAMLGTMTVYVDESGIIHKYVLRDATTYSEEKAAERIEILTKNPTYALFLTTPVIGS